MKLLWLMGLTALLNTGEVFAQTFQNSWCSYPYSCGSENIISHDNRPRPHVVQPQTAKEIMGSCESPLPRNMSYNAEVMGVTCGESAEARDRFPLEVPAAIMERWDVLSRSGRADTQEIMQEIRQSEIKWTGEIEIPMYESWTWQEKVGDFDSRCGTEAWVTTCARSRQEEYEDVVEERYCAEYGSHSESSDFGGGSSNGSSSKSGYSSPYSNGGFSSSPKGHGEDSKSLRKGWDGSQNEQLPSTKDIFKTSFIERSIASHCVRWATRTNRVKRTRSASTVTYACQKTRPLYCEWLETRNQTRRCKNHTAKYQLQYKKDINWRPGYVDASQATIRSYNDVLPNKWDLLPGESEEVFIYANSGMSRMVAPKVVFKSKWNQYEFTSNPSSIQCQYRMAPEFSIDVNTLGRLKTKAPNPLAVPRDKDGNALEPIKFADINGGRGRPYQIQLQDIGRATMLAAAQNSRNFPRPDGSGTADPNAIYKKHGAPVKGTSASGGYWQETRFKMQLFRKDKWNRPVRITLPNTFGSNQADIFDDSVTISLEGRDGLDRFYRPGGPLEFIFGSIYKKFGVELTPGQSYFIKFQVVQRGLPFYEAGCKEQTSVCEGDEATTDSYSESIILEFTADSKVDQRSWFKRFKDWQEKFLIL